MLFNMLVLLIFDMFQHLVGMPIIVFMIGKIVV